MTHNKAIIGKIPVLNLKNHKFTFSHHLDIADLNELVDDGGGEAANDAGVEEGNVGDPEHSKEQGTRKY